MTQPVRMDAKTARDELTDHRFYRYRGCAPDPDDPRVAAGDPSLPVDAWQAPDVDGGEEPEERAARVAAAKAVCAQCPVRVACAVFGASVLPDGRLAEQHSILGGRTALERTKALVEERQAVPVVPVPAPAEQLCTEQKLAVLRAWAVHESAVEVARAAGLDVRTANWQRARITTQLGLGKSASRAEVLEAAVARGLLRREEIAAPDPGPAAVTVLGGRRGVRGRRVASVPGQLAFFDAAPVLGAAA